MCFRPWDLLKRSVHNFIHKYKVATQFLIHETENHQTRDPESGKPAFRWIGEGGSSINGSSAKNCKRAFGSDITNTSVKKCNTNPSSEKHQKHGSKDFVFGPFAPNLTISQGHENGGQIRNLDDLFCDYQPQYSNKGNYTLSSRFVI